MVKELIVTNRTKDKSVVVLVSDEDYEEVSKLPWYIGAKCNYAKETHYISSWKFGTLHKYIYKLMYPHTQGYSVGTVIDHIDRNPLNNTRDNLRLASRSLNNHNRSRPPGKYSTYKGVTYDKKMKHKIWKATFKGKHLGSFETELEAAKCYDAYAIHEYGYQGACHNGLLKEDEAAQLYTIREQTRKKCPKADVRGYAVDKRKKTLLYEARITINGQFKFLGSFKCPDQARQAYLDARLTALSEMTEDHKKTPITRNDEGLAVIPAYDKHGNIKSYAIVDDDKWHELSLSRWSEHNGYFSANVNGKRAQLHAYLTNAPKYQIVDHINRNPRDNRLCNLRFATYQQNAQNTKKRKTYDSTCTSKYKGVHRRGPLFLARIIHNGQTVDLGTHQSEGLAALAYNEKAMELCGEFAFLNDIDPEDMEPTELQKASRGTRAYHAKRSRVENASSKYWGVFKTKQGKYFSKVQKDKEHYHCGHFDTEEEAALAYNIKAQEVYGSLAKLNDIPEDVTLRENIVKSRAVNSNGKACSSNYRGVCFQKSMKKFRAALGYNKQRITIGYFDTPEQAARAYNEKAMELLGTKAYLNVIPEEAP